MKSILYNEETGINKTMNQNLSSRFIRQASQFFSSLSTIKQSQLDKTTNDTISAKRDKLKKKACSSVKKIMTLQKNSNIS